MKTKTHSALCAALLLAAFTSQLAQAQSKPPKMVTRDELRVCMNTEADLAERRKALEARGKQNREEGDAIKAERDVLAEDAKRVGDDSSKIEKFDKRVKAHNARVQTQNTNAEAFRKDADGLNASLVAYNDKCGGITYDKADKEAILKEREAAAKK